MERRPSDRRTSMPPPTASACAVSAAAVSAAAPLAPLVRSASFQAPMTTDEFVLLPLCHSAHGSITGLAVWQSAVYIGTTSATILKYDLEYTEDDRPSAESDHHHHHYASTPSMSSSSALRPPLDAACSFSIVRIALSATLDARKYHKAKGTTAPLTDLQLCPLLGVLFALSEGALCAYDLRGLKFQQRIKPPVAGHIDRYAVWPTAAHSVTQSPTRASRSPTTVSICVCMQKKLFVLTRSMDDMQGAWVVQQELFIPESAHCVHFIDSVHILIGFRREYSVINSITGDVTDLCSIDSSAVGGGGDTIIQRLASQRSLLNSGTKALIHYCDGDAHVLADAMPYATAPRAIGSSTVFALTLDAAHLHVYLSPRNHTGVWRETQKIPVANASLMWSDGGPLVLLSKGAQLYFCQPILAADREKDRALLQSVKLSYFSPAPGATEWMREQAVKAITSHVQQALVSRGTHPFACMIRSFDQYLHRLIRQLRTATIPSPTNANAAASSSTATTSSTASTATASAGAINKSPSPIDRAALVTAVREFQDLVTMYMRLMWSDMCTEPRPSPASTPSSAHSKRLNLSASSNATSNSTASDSTASKSDFLSECRALFDEALFRRIYPRLFALYVERCAPEDQRFVDCCASYVDRAVTMEHFGSTILQKSPWLQEQRDAALKAKMKKRATNNNATSPPDAATTTGARDIPNAKPHAPNDDPDSLPSTPHGSSSVPEHSPSSPKNHVRAFAPISSSFHPLSPNPLLEKAFERTGPLTSLSTPVTPATTTPSTGQWPTAAGALPSALVLSTMLADTYQPSISLLKMLPFPTSPVAKLKLLTRVHYQLVTDSQKLYDPTGLKQFTMSADELLPIFCYILIQAKLTQPFAETEMMMDFLPEDAAIGADGYTVTTMQIALSQITHPAAIGANSLTSSPNGHTTFTLPPSQLLAALTRTMTASVSNFLPTTPAPGTTTTGSPPTGTGLTGTSPSSPALARSSIGQHFIPVPSSAGSTTRLLNSFSPLGVSPEDSPLSHSPASQHVGPLSLTRTESLGNAVHVLSPTPPPSIRPSGIGSALLAASLQRAKSPPIESSNTATSQPIPIGAPSAAAAGANNITSPGATTTGESTSLVLPSPIMTPSAVGEWDVDVEAGKKVLSMELRTLTTSPPPSGTTAAAQTPEPPSSAAKLLSVGMAPPSAALAAAASSTASSTAALRTTPSTPSRKQ